MPKLPEPENVDGQPLSAELRQVFGENLKALRHKARLHQEDLAARTGFAQQYLSLIENGKANITVETMATLAKEVGGDVSAMLKRKANRLPKP